MNECGFCGENNEIWGPVRLQQWQGDHIHTKVMCVECWRASRK